MRVDRIPVPRLHRECGVAGSSDLRELERAGVQTLDLANEGRREPYSRQVPALLIRDIAVDITCVTVASIDKKTWRDGVDMVDRGPAIVTKQNVTHRIAVALVLHAVISGGVCAHVKALFFRDIVIDSKDMVVVIVVRIPAVGIVVHAVDVAGQIRRVIKLRDLRPERIDSRRRDDVVRQRLTAEEAARRRGNRIGIVDLISRA